MYQVPPATHDPYGDRREMSTEQEYTHHFDEVNRRFPDSRYPTREPGSGLPSFRTSRPWTAVS